MRADDDCSSSPSVAALTAQVVRLRERATWLEQRAMRTGPWPALVEDTAAMRAELDDIQGSLVAHERSVREELDDATALVTVSNVTGDAAREAQHTPLENAVRQLEQQARERDGRRPDLRLIQRGDQVPEPAGPDEPPRRLPSTAELLDALGADGPLLEQPAVQALLDHRRPKQTLVLLPPAS